MTALIGFLAAAASTWQLIAGMNSGTMSALGQVYTTAEREKQPIRFWLFSGFNVIMLISGVWLFGSEFSK